MKVVLFGTASYPFLFRDLVVYARQKYPDIEWHQMVFSWRHEEAIRSYMPSDHVFYVHPEVNKAFNEEFRQEDLKNYPGSIFESIAVDKGVGGQVTTKNKEYQLRNAAAFYRVYKSYLQRVKPDAVFIPIIETHDAMIFYRAVMELGIEPVIYGTARTLGCSFFTASPNEDLPPYAFKNSPSDEQVRAARTFIEKFQKDPGSAVPPPPAPAPEDLLSYPPRLHWSQNLFSRLPRAFINLFKDLNLEPHASRHHPFWYQPRIQLADLRIFIMKLLGRWNSRYFELKSMDGLPDKFIYFPLQVSPESSINALAPLFVDQERAVDLFLHHMPSDYRLVVKEHPKMVGTRKAEFYETLHKKPGVVLADSRLPGLELIKRAALTASVTGTAALEALLLGKPSLILGKTFFSPWVPTFDSLAHFREELDKAMKQDSQAISSRAVDCAAHIFSCGYDFILADPYQTWGKPQLTMNKGNLSRLLDAFVDHLRKTGMKV